MKAATSAAIRAAIRAVTGGALRAPPAPVRPVVAIALAGMLLAGCATPSQQAAQAERDVDMMIQIYGPACQKLGFQPNTDGWRNCLIGLSQKDAAAAASSAYAGPPYWRYPF